MKYDNKPIYNFIKENKIFEINLQKLTDERRLKCKDILCSWTVKNNTDKILRVV